VVVSLESEFHHEGVKVTKFIGNAQITCQPQIDVDVRVFFRDKTLPDDGRTTSPASSPGRWGDCGSSAAAINDEGPLQNHRHINVNPRKSAVNNPLSPFFAFLAPGR
jgi:hypothetical protein